jgi:hypothetical protein
MKVVDENANRRLMEGHPSPQEAHLMTRDTPGVKVDNRTPSSTKKAAVGNKSGVSNKQDEYEYDEYYDEEEEAQHHNDRGQAEV